MQLPLSFSDVILFLGATATLLLLTSEVISSYYGRTNMLIDKRRFRLAALFFCAFFFLTALFAIYGILM